jgi:hypothetical protein
VLIPSKYENVSQNILSIGADIIKTIRGRKNIYALYKKVIEARNDEYKISFDKYLLALDTLYALDKIEIEGQDIVRK